MDAKTAKFTLRFHNSQTHELLGLMADLFGVSKNQLAEEMLERELRAASLLQEHDLSGTLERLHNYRTAERLEEDIEAIAHAEAYEHDPLRSRHVETPSTTTDPYGIEALFAAST
jgi:hypothetical protein